MDLKKYFLARLSESSTWRGLINLLAASGIAINPDILVQIVAIAAAINGGIGLLTPDKPITDKPKEIA